MHTAGGGIGGEQTPRSPGGKGVIPAKPHHATGHAVHQTGAPAHEHDDSPALQCYRAVEEALPHGEPGTAGHSPQQRLGRGAKARSEEKHTQPFHKLLYQRSEEDKHGYDGCQGSWGEDQAGQIFWILQPGWVLQVTRQFQQSLHAARGEHDHHGRNQNEGEYDHQLCHQSHRRGQKGAVGDLQGHGAPGRGSGAPPYKA